ncbi:MAG: hypothetical protein KDA49_00305 [Rhodospirillaceae bacterium]|nr:hypothetical protein [Rhodospirillaceae bacterium]MCA8930875.1 hypothetical protein [Rhodospirillaceae bacterium]
MTWSNSQQLRLEAILNGTEARPSIYDRSRTNNSRDQMPDVPDVDLTFDDVVDIVNPLHHVPLVGSGYRAISGDTISPHAQMIGDVLYGGPTGIFSAGVNAAIRQETGRDVGELAFATLSGTVETAGDGAGRQGLTVAESAESLAAQPAQLAQSPAAPPAVTPAANPAATPAQQGPAAQVPRAQTASVDLAPALPGAQTAELMTAAPPVFAPAHSAPPAAAPISAPAAEVAGPTVGAAPEAVVVARVAPPAGAIAAYATRAPATTGPSLSPAQVDAPAQGPSVAAGPQIGAEPPAAQTVQPAPGGGPVEISVTLDAALMALAGNPGGVTAGPPATAAVPPERLRQADAAYRRSAGAVAVY